MIELEGAAKSLVLYTRDISIGGMFLEHDAPPPVGTRARVRMLSPDGGGVVRCTGTVVRRVLPGDEGEDALGPGFGLELVVASKATEHALEQIVERARRWANAGSPGHTLHERRLMDGSVMAPLPKSPDLERLEQLRSSLTAVMDPRALEAMVHCASADPEQIHEAFRHLARQSSAGTSTRIPAEMRSMAAEICLRIEHAYRNAYALATRERAPTLTDMSAAADTTTNGQLQSPAGADGQGDEPTPVPGLTEATDAELFSRSLALVQEERWTEALEPFAEVVRRHRTANLEAQLFVIQARHAEGVEDFDTALEHYEAALELVPDHPVASRELARMLEQM